MKKDNLITAIRFRMSARGYTSRILADKAGVPYSTVCKFLSSESEIGTRKFIALLEALDLDLVSMITFQDKSFLSNFPKHVQKHLIKITEGN